MNVTIDDLRANLNNLGWKEREAEIETSDVRQALAATTNLISELLTERARSQRLRNEVQELATRIDALLESIKEEDGEVKD